MNVKKAIKIWLPSAVTFFAAVITAVIISVTGRLNYALNYAIVFVSAVIPVIITLLNIKFKLGITQFAIILVCVHVVLAANFGSAFGFNNIFLWWDMFLHGLFGLVCGAVLLCLYIRFTGKRPNIFGLFTILLMVVGVAALWEVYEFVASSFTGTDMQKIEESVELYGNPLFDTITDIAIAMAGVALFYLSYYIDYVLGGKLYGKIASNS